MNRHAQVPLGEIYTVNPCGRTAEYPDDTVVRFVTILAVDEQKGKITVRQERTLSEVAKGYISFEEGDILFAKITPCMENGKVALAQDLTNTMGRGSIEFHILWPGESVLGEHIYYFLRQSQFRKEAKKNFTGTAGQQRVPKSFMQEFPIPLPPLNEQRRIDSIQNRTAKLERLRKQAQVLLRELIPVQFIKMFGDPVENPVAWEEVRVCDLGTVDSGAGFPKKEQGD